jgi:glutathione S-transferase
MGKKLKEEVFPNIFKKFEAILNQNGNGVLVGSGITYADIFVAHYFSLFTPGFEIKDLLQKHSALSAHQDKVFNLPGIKEWVTKRPVTQW